MPGTIVATNGSFRLGGGHVQRAGPDVVDAAGRQLVDQLHQAFRFGRQAHNGIFPKQRAGFLRFQVGLPNMHAVNFDALVTCLPNYIHAIVDHKRHGIGFAVVLDNLRDIACHAGDVFRVGVLGSQLDERCTPAQRILNHTGNSTALAILRADHKVGAHIECIAHRCI